MTNAAWVRRAGDKRRVVVVGAGVAGMTAAHELVERGYDVEVVEMSADPYNSHRPRIGGMARTSWACVPLTSPASAPDVAGAARAPVQLTMDCAPPPIDAPLKDVLKPKRDGHVDVFLRKLTAPTPGNPPQEVLHPSNTAPGVRLILAKSLTAQQQAALRAVETKYSVAFHPLVAIRKHHKASGKPAQKAEQVHLSAESARASGEHGFRFFPSFYRHLFDTMKRIPIAQAAIQAIGEADDGMTLVEDSSRSVFDALRSAEVIELGLARSSQGDRSFEIPRRPMRSPSDLRTLFLNCLERAGYRGQDLVRLATRYTEYLTSGRQRRVQQYEATSWSEFLGLEDGGGFSRYFAGHVTSGAQALVAMSSDTNDARTIGSIAMQLTLDQVRANPSGYTDATLRGPTSLELFEPWRQYLQTEGVVFTCAQLVGFQGKGTDGRIMAVRPVFGTPASNKDPSGASLFKPVVIAPADYYVITIPVDKFQSLFTNKQAAWKSQTGRPALLGQDDVVRANRQCLELDRQQRPADDPNDPVVLGESDDDVSKFLNFEIGALAAAPDAGPLRYMCGIQFYFAADVRVLLGHTICLDSPWGVSYISQTQYWQDRPRGQSGVRGILSAIFTRFEVPAPDAKGEDPRCALRCTPDQIAERVWKQIADAWNVEQHGVLPSPIYYYLDESLSYDGATWTNRTPYLVNMVTGPASWGARGGVRTRRDDYRYRMQFGHTVFAGAFMRTQTRLNTMEAANESARRAVNTIVTRDNQDSPQVQLAQLWNMEDYELPEAQPLCAVDDSIFERGGRHVLRHAGIDAALRLVPWDLLRLGLRARGETR